MSKIVITLDASQMKEFLTCEHAWYYKYVENLRFWKFKTIYMDRGTFVHKLLEVFYILRTLNPKEDRYKHFNAVIEMFKKGTVFKAHGLDKDDVKFICERFLQYVIKWTAYDFVPTQKNGVVGVELGFSKVLKETEDYLFIVEGKIDLLSKLPDGRDVFVDNKTQERISELYANRPQFLTYSWATGIRFGMINYFKLDKDYKEEETFRRRLFYYPEHRIEEWEHQMLRIFYKIYVSTKESNGKIINFTKNLVSCAGPDEKRPCIFSLMCDNPEQLQLIKQQYYYKGIKWSPWSSENTQELLEA